MSANLMTEAKFDAGGVSLNYAVGPVSGPPLLLLHGGSARWQYFDPILPDLAAHWQLFALDLRGHGKSGRTPGHYALRDYADDVCALLLRVSGPASLFGHSLGGMAALLAAARCPERVNAVVVGDSPLDAELFKAAITPWQREQIRGWQALAGGTYSVDEISAGLRDMPVAVPGQTRRMLMREVYPEDNGVYAHLAERLYDNDPDMLRMLLDEIDTVAAGYNLAAYGPRIKCPVLLLQADPARGGAMPDVDVALALRCLPHVSHRRLPGVGHLLFHEDKAAVLSATEAFLQAVNMGDVASWRGLEAGA
jgi:pimeloyl-ACP methyl ester carboxylesterase